MQLFTSLQTLSLSLCMFNIGDVCSGLHHVRPNGLYRPADGNQGKKRKQSLDSVSVPGLEVLLSEQQRQEPNPQSLVVKGL